MKYTADDYLRHDPWDGVDRDVHIRNRKTMVIATRREQTCVPPVDAETHRIPIGTTAFKEMAFVEGVPVTCYVCADHMDAYIDWIKKQGATA